MKTMNRKKTKYLYRMLSCCFLFIFIATFSACYYDILFNTSIYNDLYMVKNNDQYAAPKTYNISNDNVSVNINNYKHEKINFPSELISMITSVQHHAIAVGHFHSAVIVDGYLWTWGYNWHGQLGDGTTITSAVPIQIGEAAKWKSVAVSYGHTIAIKYDGSLWGWGYNFFGEIGDGTTENRMKPTQIGDDTDWVRVFAGVSHSLAIKADGSLWAWGRNTQGRLGNGTSDDQLTPTRITMYTDWVYILPSAMHTLALRSDGGLWFWGSNRNIAPQGSLSRIYDIPIQIGTYKDLMRMIAEVKQYHSFIIQYDHTLWARGNNSNGQLGDGTTTNRDAFVQIGTDDTWLYVSSGAGRTVGIKIDGSVWSWGWAGFRQCSDTGERIGISLIGDAGDENRLHPVKIINSTSTS